jgi:hypothetical protein
VYGLSIFQQDDSQIPALHLLNGRPPTNTAVTLDSLSDGMIDHVLNPLQPDSRTVRTAPYFFEILRELHFNRPSCGGSLTASTTGGNGVAAEFPSVTNS